MKRRAKQVGVKSQPRYNQGCKRCKFPCLKLLNADGIKKTNWCEERGMKMLELVMARTEIQPWQAKQGKPQVPIHPFLRF
ncbi:hypothetical protein V6N13_058347 [Hibiscus sabdariffa]